MNQIFNEDCRTGLKKLPDQSVNCCVTSPPYFGLRDYGTGKWEGGNELCNHERDSKKSNKSITGSNNVIGGIGDGIYKDICRKCGAKRIDEQVGLEETPELYVQNMVEIFREVKRVLKDDGTLWLNLGDSYWGGKGTSGASSIEHLESRTTSTINGKQHNIGKKGWIKPGNGKHNIIKPKDLIGIPWMVAFALRADGWYLRQDIIWHKPNPMPESVTDRCTKSHEYIFLMSKSKKYYYDQEAIKTEISDTTIKRLMQDTRWQKGSERVPGKTNGPMKAVGNRKGYSHRGTGDKKLASHSGNFDADGNIIGDGKANKKSVWTVTTKPFKEAHFATFPEKLIEPCILAGCPEGGIVLDPFMGAATTAVVAKKLGRQYVGYELNPEYIRIGEKRLYDVGMF